LNIGQQRERLEEKMAFAVVRVTGPNGRLVYINGGRAPEGLTNKEYAVEEGLNTFELKASPKGPAMSRRVNVITQDPPMVVDLTPV